MLLLLSPSVSNAWEVTFGSQLHVHPSKSLLYIWQHVPLLMFSPQVQKVSLNPAYQPHPSFTSSLVPTMEPPPDMAQPAERPRADTDPSVSTSSPRPQLIGHYSRVVKQFYSPAK